MIKAIESILLSSENATNLANFYKDRVGLKVGEEMEMGDEGEKGYDITFGSGASLYILDHSKVKGKNAQPERVMFNLEVDDAEKEAQRLKEEGIKVVEDVYHVEGYGLVATFEDIDGNYFQLVQVRG